MGNRVLTVRDLLEVVPHTKVVGSPDRSIEGITCDSREVVPSGLFAALKGFQRDGRDFVPEALERGARTILSHAPPVYALNGDATWIVSPRDREAYSAACAAFYGTEEANVKLAGVTGTNGKTTVVYLLRSIFARVGPTGMLGTIEYDHGADVRPAGRTTPEAHEIHRFIKNLEERGAGYGVMEVSSHAVALHRVRDVRYSAAVFTNLTRDHMDFHKTMENYYRVKRSFFDLLLPGGVAVIDIENPYGLRLVQEIGPGNRITVGMESSANVYPSEVHMDLSGIQMTAETPWGRIELTSALTGSFNRHNLLSAAATAMALGVSPEEVAAGIQDLKGVPGRLERVDAGQPFTILVDYAHTDDALKNLLSAVKEVTQGRLLTVFGCGGDRDRTKRPLMGAVVSRLSDVIFLTSDNPRTEDPEAILNDVEAGVKPELSPGKKYHRIADRREAIRLALATARSGDVLVIAGKGHEPYLLKGGETLSFHDPTVTRELLTEMGWH